MRHVSHFATYKLLRCFEVTQHEETNQNIRCSASPWSYHRLNVLAFFDCPEFTQVGSRASRLGHGYGFPETRAEAGPNLDGFRFCRGRLCPIYKNHSEPDTSSPVNTSSRFWPAICRGTDSASSVERGPCISSRQPTDVTGIASDPLGPISGHSEPGRSPRLTPWGAPTRMSVKSKLQWSAGNP